MLNQTVLIQPFDKRSLSLHAYQNYNLAFLSYSKCLHDMYMYDEHSLLIPFVNEFLVKITALNLKHGELKKSW